jgi:hypothetical protein
MKDCLQCTIFGMLYGQYRQVHVNTLHAYSSAHVTISYTLQFHIAQKCDTLKSNFLGYYTTSSGKQNYHCLLRNNPEKRSSRLLRGESQK